MPKLFAHVDHAGGATVRAWQRHPMVRLKRLRKAGCAIATLDECFMARDKAAGRVRVEMGKAAVQVHTGSRERIAVFGYEDGTHRFQEYKFADSHAMFSPLARIAGEFGKVTIIMGRASSHNSGTMKRLLRECRRDHPGRGIHLIFLPRGSPCLDAVEGWWALPKANVVRFYLYPRLDDFRWAVTGHLETTKYRLKWMTFCTVTE